MRDCGFVPRAEAPVRRIRLRREEATSWESFKRERSVERWASASGEGD